ncbi:retrovirus-related pol polyprotein from transposon TNT 1-94 [Tanacetum coccineum]
MSNSRISMNRIRETVGSPVVQQSGIQCFNCKEFGHYAKECIKPKRVRDSTYHKEKIFAKFKQLRKIQEVPKHTQSQTLSPLEQNDQHDVECDDERVALANLIANLKLDVDDNKKIQKQLKKANATLTQELTECKSILAETSRTLGESNSIRDSCLVALQNKQTEFERYKAFNDRTIDYDKLERKLNDTLGLLAQKDIDIQVRSHYEGLVKEKTKGKSVDTKFDKPSVVRQPNAQRLPKPSVLGKPAPFSNSLERQYFAKKKSVLKTNESESLSKPVTLQNLPKTAMKAVRNTNVIKPGMYRIASSTTQTRAPQLNQTFRNTNPRASTFTGVAHTTNVSRPQPRSNQMKDKVVPYTSHAKLKKTEVEEHPRISSISNKTKSVTACNDSLNSRSSNANAVCATCGKCVFNANHDSCVTKFLNEVNSRAKVPSNKTTNRNKPVEQISFAKKPERQIPKRHMSSIKKTSVVHEKTMTPRSCLRWKPTGKIFKTVGLRWVPTGKIFTSSTTKVDSEPQNGSNADITNQYESAQTLDVSAGTSNLSAGTSFNPKKEGLRVWLLKRLISEKPRLQGIFHLSA